MSGIKRTAKWIFELCFLLLIAIVAFKAVRYGFNAYYEKAYPIKFAAEINAVCAEKKLDRALVYAVVRTESGFDPDAESPVGARGLMQLMPSAFEWVQMRKGGDELVYDHMYDPATNIDYGTSMLRILMDEFHTVDNVLCAYHAGWGSVKAWLQNPEYAPDGKNVTNIPFEDTKAYVAKVKKTIEVYRRLYDL